MLRARLARTAAVVIVALVASVGVTAAATAAVADGACTMSGLAGRVTFGDLRRAAHAGEVTISLQPEAPVGAPASTTSTDSDGRWIVPCIATGYYQMVVHDTGARYADLSDRILLTSARSIYSNFGVSGELVGTMRTPNGVALSGQAILYVDYGPGIGRGNLERQAVGSNGIWAFQDIPLSNDQRWGLEFRPADTRYAPQYWNARNLYQSRTMLDVDDLLAGVQMNAVLPLAARLSGQLTGVPSSELASGRLEVEPIILDDASGRWVATGDIHPVDADGNYEIERLSPGDYRVRAHWRSGGDGSPTDTATVTLDPGEDADLDIAMTTPELRRDLTADGLADVLVRDTSGRLYAFEGSRRPYPVHIYQLGSKRLIGTGWGTMTAIVQAGDFSGDGLTDIIARDKPGALWLYAGTSSGGLSPRVKIGSGWATLTAILATGDMNSDGTADLVARDAAGTLYLYPGDGAGHFLSRVKIGTGWKTITALVGPGDWNSDGDNDLIARDAAGAMWLYPGNGASGLGARVRLNIYGINFKTLTAIFSLGDADEDHDPDLIVREASGSLRVYLNGGDNGLVGQDTLGTGFKTLTIAP